MTELSPRRDAVLRGVLRGESWLTAAIIPMKNPYCSCKLTRAAEWQNSRRPAQAGLNMFCQYIQLWMHAVPAADLWGAGRAVGREQPVAPALEGGADTLALNMFCQ